VREATNVVKLRGLPFTAGKEDIMHWFSDVQATPLTEDGCAGVGLGSFSWGGRGGEGVLGPPVTLH